MAGAQAFETDFWKDANLRKVWDDIVPGEPRKTIPYTLTKEAIELYIEDCRDAGDPVELAGRYNEQGADEVVFLDITASKEKRGIIIGLIAKGNNLVVPFVAFFIAVLEIGASAMQRTMMIPGEMVFIVESLILLFVLLSDVIRRR